MKSTVRSFMLATALVAIAALSQTMRAQTNYTARVQIPFGFEVGHRHFYPGTYKLGMMDDNNILIVSGLDRSAMLIVHGGTSGGDKAGYVMFRRYGNRYFLAEYHERNSETSVVAVPSENERSIAREVAANRAADAGRVRLALLSNEIGRPSGQ